MSGGFDGLEKFGLGSLKDIDIYENKGESVVPDKDKKEGKVVMSGEEEHLFDKTFKCPCCGTDFKAKAVRVGKNKLIGHDRDLRPIYAHVDATKYDAIVCVKCGYAGLLKNFDAIGDKYIKSIREKISTRFKGFDNTKGWYTYEEAIERTQLALLSTVVKGGRNSEKAYVCLKLAWLTRGMKEALDKNAADYESKYEEMEKAEEGYLKNAYDGFSDAYMNENFPICGMDENTLSIIMAETARKMGKKNEALRYIEKIILSKDATERMRDMARDLREECKKD